MAQQVVCTIVTKSYLPFARVLFDTLKRHNPDAQLYVLLADHPDGYFDPREEPFNVILLDDLSDQCLVQRMCFYYTPLELCCALRGLLHEYMYDQQISESWIYLDSDIAIFGSLQPIFEQLQTTSILLSPHISSPVDSAYVNPLEIEVLACGVYNGGFLGLKRSEETNQFVHWFKDRLAQFSFNRRGKDSLKWLFLDQLWLNLIPQFFQDVSFLSHPGTNVAYWSLHSRTVTKVDNSYFVNGEPLLFVHFSCWNIAEPATLHTTFSFEQLTRYWSEWGQYYRELLLAHGYEICKSYSYSFDRFTSGQRILSGMRDFYYEQLRSGDISEMNPFDRADYFISEFRLQKIKDTTDKVWRKFAVLHKSLERVFQKTYQLIFQN
jgi:hypothetical protein